MLDTAIRFTCPRCSKRLKAGSEAIGRKARCTRCGHSVCVPEYSSRAEPIARPEPPPLPATKSQAAEETWWDEIPILSGKAVAPATPARSVEGLTSGADVLPSPPLRGRGAGGEGVKARSEKNEPFDRSSPNPLTPTLSPEAGERERECGIEVADNPGGNPLANLDLAASNGVQAAHTLAKIRKALPETESAYRPSGQVPAAGVVFLFAGMGVGAIAAAIVRTILIVVGMFAIGFLATVVANMKDVMAVIGAIVLVIGALAYFGFVYFAAGATTAYTMRLFGRMGKCRSPGIEAVMSACSVAAAVILMWFVALAYTAESEHKSGDMSADTMQVLATIEALIGGLIAIITAAMFSVNLVKKAKFCEQCEAHMGHKVAKSLSVVDLHPIVGHLADRNLAGFKNAVDEAATGTGGKVEAFTCLSCGDGFIELRAGCSFSWKEGNKTKTLAKEWLVQSAAVTKEEVERAIQPASDR